MTRIFLCHANEDKEPVEEIYHRLAREDGLKPWMDKLDLLPGQNWRQEIPHVLKGSDFVMIFLSQTSISKRGYVQLEFKLALDVLKEIPAGTIHTIPVRLDDFEIPDELPDGLKDLHWGDLSHSQGFDLILRAIRAGVVQRKPFQQEAVTQAVPALPVEIEPNLKLQGIQYVDFRHDSERSRAAFAQASMIAAERGLIPQLLDRYYDAESTPSEGLTRYEITFDRRRLRTTLVTKPEWVGCNVALNGKQDSYRLVDTPETPRIDSTTFDEKRRVVESRGQVVEDNSVYRLIGIDIRNGRLQAEFCGDNYFRYRFSNGGMQDEIITALSENDLSVEEVLENRERSLPIRQRLMRRAADVATPSSRICAGGVNVLVAFARPREQDYALVLQHRSGKVGSRQGQLTTIPSGHHQPMISLGDELSIVHTVRRELLEELFGVKEAQHGKNYVVYRDLLKNKPPLKWLDDHCNAYDLSLTGFGFSLVTGSYTFSVLLAIHDVDFWESFAKEMKTNWEARGSQVVSTKGDTAIKLIEDSTWTDYGLCTFVEGLRCLSAIGGDRIDLPYIPIIV